MTRKKKIIELKPGDIFLDSFGIPLKVEKLVPLPWNGIPRTQPKIKVFFISGNKRMFMRFPKNQIVELKRNERN